MDERMLVDQFHEALDIEPRPGAYERMRIAMTDHPVAVQSRPAFRMRWSKMGLRVAAVLAAAVIATAVGAVILAGHGKPVGSIPAGADPNVEAYQVMMNSNYDAMNASTPDTCVDIQDKGCRAFLGEVTPRLEHWISDLTAFHTPTRFAVIDGQLRRHLNQALADLNAAVALQKANNRSGFDLAMSAAVYERAWIDPATFAIEGRYVAVAHTYFDAASLARQSLYSCIDYSPGPAELGCNALTTRQTCAAAAAQTCERDVQNAATQIQTFLIALAQNAAPGARSARYMQLQTDLGQADTALLTITDALLSGDSAKADAGEMSYGESIVAAYGDTNAVLSP
jgi:hypothetical protein